MKWKILVSWPGSDGWLLGIPKKQTRRWKSKMKHKTTKNGLLDDWCHEKDSPLSPTWGKQSGSVQLPLQENHPHAASQCKVSLFQQVPNTQLVRKRNARQPITMRNDQGFHPLLHLRVSNCPISRFPFQLIPENVLKVKFAESFCITWWSKSSVIVARLLFSNV